MSKPLIEIHVAAAVILDSSGHIFVAKRLADAHQGGLWEFPGGKLESGERAEQALIRELEEELGIGIAAPEPFISIPFCYPDKSVFLEVFKVTEFTGEPFGKEGQETAWVTVAELQNLQFPAANLPILEKITALL